MASHRGCTGCVACAAVEKRSLTITLPPKVARQLARIVDAHVAQASRGIRGDRLVSVDTKKILAELIAREVARLRDGGRPGQARAVRVKRLRLAPEARRAR